MYLRIDENGYQFTEEQPENRAYIGIFTYDMMQEQAKLRNISYHVLEDALVLLVMTVLKTMTASVWKCRTSTMFSSVMAV